MSEVPHKIYAIIYPDSEPVTYLSEKERDEDFASDPEEGEKVEYFAHLATETAALQKVRDEMAAEIHVDEAQCERNAHLCGCHRLRPYIAALDEILGRRE